MRASKIGLWLSAFLVAGSASAFCQVIVQPNGSGHSVPVDAQAGVFQESVATSGTFDYTLAVFKNSQLKYYGGGTVCTSGPSATVNVNLAFSSFGLAAGDTLTFIFTVQHQGTDGNSRSTVVSFIPVVPKTTATRPISRLERRSALKVDVRREDA